MDGCDGCVRLGCNALLCVECSKHRSPAILLRRMQPLSVMARCPAIAAARAPDDGATLQGKPQKRVLSLAASIGRGWRFNGSAWYRATKRPARVSTVLAPSLRTADGRGVHVLFQEHPS